MLGQGSDVEAQGVENFGVTQSPGDVCHGDVVCEEHRRVASKKCRKDCPPGRVFTGEQRRLQYAENDAVLSLVRDGLAMFDDAAKTTTSVIRQCIRIARFRGDFVNLWWLEQELYNRNDRDGFQHVVDEIIVHFNKAQFDLYQKKFKTAYAAERTISTRDEAGRQTENKAVVVRSVSDIEAQIERARRFIENQPPVSGSDLNSAFLERDRQTKIYHHENLIADWQTVIARIRQRLFSYLSRAEAQLMAGCLSSDIFEDNRQYVDQRLAAFAPDVLAKFSSVYKRVSEGDSEALSQGILSCRRVLHEVADLVYPAKSEPVVGTDGKSRELSADKYIARLWQFISDRLGNSSVATVLHATTDDLGARLDALYGLASKGTHADVSRYEANMCALQTYLLVGDILRLHEADVAAPITTE